MDTIFSKLTGWVKMGSPGAYDSYDNALAETINGLYKAELIHLRAPWKTRESVELATLEWVSWFNHHRSFLRCADCQQTLVAAGQGRTSANFNLQNELFLVTS